jgi:hypothetical protein
LGDESKRGNEVETTKKLVKCRIVQPDHQGAWRFVELENFRLWEYLMHHKHNLHVEALAMCLWVPDAHYQSKRGLFEHAGTVFPLTQVAIERYDPNYRFIHRIYRFCLTDETDEFVARLKSHMRGEDGPHADWELTVSDGWGIEPNVHELIEPTALGLG